MIWRRSGSKDATFLFLFIRGPALILLLHTRQSFPKFNVTATIVATPDSASNLTSLYRETDSIISPLFPYYSKVNHLLGPSCKKLRILPPRLPSLAAPDFVFEAKGHTPRDTLRYVPC